MYVNKPVKPGSYGVKESKNVILYEVFKTIWTHVRTCQNGHATPLQWLLPAVKFATIFIT